VLLDECVDRRLATDIRGHEFDAFVTVDRNLSFQQELSRFSMAIIVLRSPSNRVADLCGLIPQLLTVLPVARRGEATWVGAEQPG
jgi:hypothetical protein